MGKSPLKKKYGCCDVFGGVRQHSAKQSRQIATYRDVPLVNEAGTTPSHWSPTPGNCKSGTDASWQQLMRLSSSRVGR
jgi:hypothetical protein